MRIPVFASLFLLAVSMSVHAADADPRAPFLEHMNYLTRDGGRWLAENPGFQGQEGQATHFGYEFKWVLGQSIVTNTIFGLDANGRRTDYWYSITWWDAQDRVIRQRNWGVGGIATTAGTMEAQSGDVELIELAGLNWSGEPFRFRDRSTRQGPDVFESVSINFRDGEWVEGQRLLWKRASDG